ncbi:MAG: cytochrome C [Chlorobi bacterium]|nr:cytochrome C [Chlorobiota bacterium]
MRSIFTSLLIFLYFISFGQGLLNSHHDFTGASWSGGEACRPCHTPHNANMEVNDSPLWNHEVTSATFQVYTSNTLDATPGQPNGFSKLCLSCHDGTVAIENHGGFTGGTWYVTWGNITPDLRDDHPISFEYSSALAATDGGLYDPATTPSGLGGTIAEDLLQSGYLQCTSCHDPHISRNTQGCSGCHNVATGQTISLSLRISNAGSALCLTCHNK